MNTAPRLLLWLTLLSAVYLFASPERQPGTGAAGQIETRSTGNGVYQDGEYRFGWPLTYSTFSVEYGNSKSTYYDFTYSNHNIKPVSLVVDIAVFGILLLSLTRYPALSSSQLWIATGLYFVIVSLLSFQLVRSFNPLDQTPFNLRIVGSDRGIDYAIFLTLFISLFFFIARVVAVLSDFTRKPSAGKSEIAR